MKRCHNIIVFFLLLIQGIQALAQPDPPPGGPGGGDPPVGGSPLDEGILFLLVFAGIYGLYLGWQLLKKRRQRKTC